MTVFCFCTDTKDSQGVQACNITEVAYNAVSVRWNPRDSPIKVAISHTTQLILIFQCIFCASRVFNFREDSISIIFKVLKLFN